MFVGWGSQRYFTEYSPSGDVLFDGRLARGNDNYRAFRFEWTGTPSTPPKVTAATADGSITGRVSRNGATGVARWELLAGTAPNALTPIGSKPSEGFETAITAQSNATLAAARAYDAAGNMLATSSPVRPAKP